jgi:hypothetical protein
MDDDRLLTTLRAALAGADAPTGKDLSAMSISDAQELSQPVPADEEQDVSRVVEAGLLAWSFRDLDERLAALAFDSADRPALAGLRGGTVPPRILTFETDALRLELEVGAHRMLGQVLPPQVVRIRMEVPDGPAREFDSDGQGRFVVEPALTGPVQLRCLPPDAEPLVTSWVLL